MSTTCDDGACEKRRDLFDAVRKATHARRVDDANERRRRERRRRRRDGATAAPLDVDELGRASWALMHTIAAYYPQKPTHAQRVQARRFFDALGDLYPCATCRADLRADVDAHPPRCESREALAKWVCERHNVVNEKLGKAKMSCAIDALDARWRRAKQQKGARRRRRCNITAPPRRRNRREAPKRVRLGREFAALKRAMLRRAKRAVKDARVTAKARATVETRDEAYARVPLRIDLDGARASDDDERRARRGRASVAALGGALRIRRHDVRGVVREGPTRAVRGERTRREGVRRARDGVLVRVARREGRRRRCEREYVAPSRVYRCGRDGDVEVWDGRERRSLASENLDAGDDEPSCASEAMRGTNFFVTGTVRGDVCVHALGVNARGETTVARRRGYRVSASRALSRVLPTRNAVAAVRARPGRDERAMMLIAWSDGALALWHLHEQRSVAVTSPRGDAVARRRRRTRL